MDNMTVKATKKSFLEQTKKPKNYLKKPKTFFNPETDLDPDRKPTFEQKTDPDPDRMPKVNPAGLALLSSQLTPSILSFFYSFLPFLSPPPCLIFWYP
jgi:hypothetical protein